VKYKLNSLKSNARKDVWNAIARFEIFNLNSGSSQTNELKC